MTLTHVVRILHITNMSLPICPKHKCQMTYMSYTLKLYPITMPDKSKLAEESAAQVDVQVDATCQGMQQLLLSSPALEMQTPGKLISRMCATFWNISGILCWTELRNQRECRAIDYLKRDAKGKLKLVGTLPKNGFIEKVSMKGSCMCLP